MQHAVLSSPSRRELEELYRRSPRPHAPVRRAPRLLDPATGSVVAAGMWPRMIVDVLGKDRVVAYDEDDRGRGVLRVYRLRVLPDQAAIGSSSVSAHRS